MAVVPRVIVHKRCSVGHSSDLISIIPPRHNPVSQCKTHQQTLLTSVGVLWTLPKGLAHTHWKEITSSCRHCSKFFNRHYLQEVLVDLTNCCWCVCVCVCVCVWGGGGYIYGEYERLKNFLEWANRRLSWHRHMAHFPNAFSFRTKNCLRSEDDI